MIRVPAIFLSAALVTVAPNVWSAPAPAAPAVSAPSVAAPAPAPPAATPAPAAAPSSIATPPPGTQGALVLAAATGLIGGWLVAGAFTEVILLPVMTSSWGQTVVRVATQLVGAVAGAAYVNRLYADSLIPTE